uniref:Uncharacterized protein LOC114334883 n=1 Tax=Diabrotica virgifera virgifera TaxID=50390 RepID=A0A6P7FWK9_DIAVI
MCPHMYVIWHQICRLSIVNTYTIFYNCHRSYSYVPRGKHIRALKSRGSCKINKACPSRMKVTMTGSLTKPSLVKVEYWKTHFGHELQLGHISLSSNTRAEIAGKLKEGVSFNHILDTIRDNVYKESNERLLILERKDLHNITRDFNIDYSTKRHQDDAISVKMWVSEMQANEDNPVVYYKGQNEEDTSTLLKQSDFVLIIMTSFQAEQFSKFGENKICIDGTHGTNAYDIQLYTIMCVDEFGTGCPVAYCFSNRSDEYIFTLFFDKLKEKIGIIKSSIFMSDDAPAFYNAWVSVMGKVDHRLLCNLTLGARARFLGVNEARLKVILKEDLKYDFDQIKKFNTEKTNSEFSTI